MSQLHYKDTLCRRRRHTLLISKCIRPYLTEAPSCARQTLLGGSRARLVRTPQAEKHISALFESRSITTNWYTEGEKDERVREEHEDKAGGR